MKVISFASNSMTDLLDKIMPVAEEIVKSSHYEMKDGGCIDLNGKRLVYTPVVGKKLESNKMMRVDEQQVAFNIMLLLVASGDADSKIKNFNASNPALVLNLLVNAIRMQSNFLWIHWHAVGEHFDCIHSITEEYYKKVSEDLDYLAEMSMIHGLEVINPLEVSKDAALLGAGYPWNEAVTTIKSMIAEYLADLTLVNAFLPDSKVDEMISYWNKELNYKLERR